jgi:hypothetical protein
MRGAASGAAFPTSGMAGPVKAGDLEHPLDVGEPGTIDRGAVLAGDRVPFE